jgi:beta-lactamase regulating signal transducer with metallopeptidase domain
MVMPGIMISVFNMSIAGGAVIILAFITRFFLRTVSKKYSYALWGVVGFRLICPFGLDFQILPNILQGKGIANIFSRTEYIPQVLGTVFRRPENSPLGIVTILLTLLFIIWGVGFVGMVAYETMSYFSAKKRLMTAVRIQHGVYETDQILTPFIFGLITPKIYVPLGISDKELRYVLSHESVHIKRRDYLIKFFGSCVLAVHWFNPFVWAAFKYMSLDMEMSCDERVVTSLGDAVRKEYSEVILALSCTKIKVTRSMLTFGASDARMRIDHMLHRKNHTRIRVVTAIFLSTVLFLGIIFNSAVSSMFTITAASIYSWELQCLETTDLIGVTVGGLQIGSDTNDLVLPTYRVTFDVDTEKKVRAIAVSNDTLLLAIDGYTAMYTIEDVTSLLGNHYLDRSEDREQQLRKRVYYDKREGITLEVVYANHNRSLAWTILGEAK